MSNDLLGNDEIASLMVREGLGFPEAVERLAAEKGFRVQRKKSEHGEILSFVPRRAR